MGVQVVTISTCDRCGKKHQEESTRGETAQEWTTITLLRHHVGSHGWGQDQEFKRTLCQSCASIVRRVLTGAEPNE